VTARGGGPPKAGLEADFGDPLEAQFEAPEPIDLRLTLAPLRHGPGDPTIHIGPDGVQMARRTATGPAVLRLWTTGDGRALHARAWGPGAAEALDAGPGLAGLLDDPAALVAHHPLIHDLQRRFPGVRLPRTGQLLPALIPAVVEQKVTAGEAHFAYAALARRLGEPAPGPAGLRLPPSGARISALPYFEFLPMGLERRRSEVLRRLGSLEARIEKLMSVPPEEARSELEAIPGVGPWTAAEATRIAFGDPDAVSVGDAHIPDMVSWALAGEPRADDERMLQLLAPYAGQRGRVVRLLEVSGIKIPRFGPRFAPRRIDRL
jgi:3-methyladenine DNA glycosylase/8-oxoguanine DNA glycosylase